MIAPKMNRPGLALLSLGHFAVDVNQGALPALLPFLFVGLDLTYATAAFIITVNNLTASIAQPLLGHYADRTPKHRLVPLGCFVASASLALGSIAPSYWLLLALVVSMGLGSAIFHPEATRTANSFAGSKRATGMALFTVGGNLGLAIGPVLLGALLVGFGRPGGLGMGILAGVVPALFLALPRRLSSVAAVIPTQGRTASAGPRRASRWPMSLLVAVIVFRQWAQTGLVTFIPLYFVNHLGEPPELANALLSALFFGSVVGTLLGGPLADRWGRKPTVSASLLIATGLLLVFLRSSGPVALLLMFVTGVIMLMSSSVTTVIGQELMPSRTGLAAGLTVGFASGLAGIGGAMLGWAADAVGITPIMLILCLLPLPGGLLCLLLPDTLRRAPSLEAAAR